MSDRPIFVSEKGFARLKAELENLQNVERPDMIERLHEAKEGSDWMDNSEYMLIQSELSFIDGRIAELEYMLDNASLIQPGADEAVVEVGDTAVIQAEDGDIEEYTIVGVAEADPEQGFISNECPLGRALLGATIGDLVAVKTPSGEEQFRLIAVKGSHVLV